MRILTYPAEDLFINYTTLQPTQQPEVALSHDSKASNDHNEARAKSPSPVLEVIKPPEKLIISFENPASDVRSHAFFHFMVLFIHALANSHI